MRSRVGLVLVSHSRALADAASGLASEAATTAPPMRVAAGMPDGGFGTDASAVASACEELLAEVGDEQGAGVVILTDLGSAVLSAEMALDFLPDPDAPVRLAAAPFVEGTLAACIAAGGGADLDTVLAEARGSLTPKVEQILGSEPDGNETGTATAVTSDQVACGAGDLGATEDGSQGSARVTREVTLINPAGLHARPAAQVAQRATQLLNDHPHVSGLDLSLNGKTPVAATSPMGLTGMGSRGGDTVTVSASGTDASQVIDDLADLIASGFGEAESHPGSAVGQGSGDAEDQAENQPTNGSPDAPSASGRGGVGVSPGRVVGQVARMAAAIAEPVATTVGQEKREAEAARIQAAADAVAERLNQRAEQATGDAADILSTTAALAADPSVVADAQDGVKNDGLNAASAVWRSFGQAAEALAAVGGRTGERATDVLDVRSRLVAELTGVAPPGLPERDRPYILVARDLAPADTAGIDPARVLGILCEEGGPTSHTAILARTLGIPAVVGSPLAATLVDNDEVLLDGSTGETVLDPGADAADARREPTPHQAATPLNGPVSTADGHHVAVRANIGGPKDVSAAVGSGAEGVGLFRTEFLFLNRTDAPSEDEQAGLYEQVLRGFSGAKVVVRTLDAGSDKPLPFLNDASEENPALGVRGLRTAWEHPDVLSTQLRALARASEACPDTELWVMAPMVATAEEATWFAEMARGAGLSTVGVMVETPAAAVTSSSVMESLDFVSLGTNDLAQYVMAADRVSAPLARLNDPWQPAVLRMIRSTVEGAAGKSVGVCGEAAADPALAPVLAGLGVDSLSMNPAAVPAVGRALGAVSLEACRVAATAALSASSPEEAKRAAGRVLGA